MNTTYFLNCIAGNVFNTIKEPTLPPKYYIGLSTTAPNVDGSGVNEPSSDAGYLRIRLDKLSEPIDGIITNEDAINFDESTSDWGTVNYFVIYDSPNAESSKLLMYGALSTPRSVEAATIMTIKAGDLKLSVQNPA